MSITFDDFGWMSGTIPSECVSACFHSGPCDADVMYWVKRLNFEVPRDKAIAWLREYGAWSLDELNNLTDTALAEKVLWLACGSIQEDGEFLGLVH